MIIKREQKTKSIAKELINENVTHFEIYYNKIK